MEIPTGIGVGLNARSSVGEYLVLAIVLAAIVLPVILLFESYGPGAVPLAVTAEALRIEDTLSPKSFPPGAVDMTTLRSVDLDMEPQLKPTKRIKGLRSREYRAGWFQSADGQPAIVYLAKEHRAIYFWDKTENVRVLIGSSKPEEVITQMRSLWAGAASK